MNTAFLFPGQGAQYVGMGADLYERFPAARERLTDADTLLGYSITELMFGTDGREKTVQAETLKQTDITQTALFVHSMAVMAVLEEHGVTPAMTAGHSLGEYSALAAAGALSFEDGLSIVNLRGRLMAQANGHRPGTMAALLGLEDAAVIQVCETVTNADGLFVHAANFNAPGQVVISGDIAAVEEALALARERGARRAVSLAVSGAFHSPLMEEAHAGLAEALEQLDLHVPHCPVYLNVTAEPTRDPGEIRTRLLEQLMAPVLWAHTLQRMADDGATRFVEVGAGTVLSGLVRRTLGRGVETVPAGKAGEVAALIGLAA